MLKYSGPRTQGQRSVHFVGSIHCVHSLIRCLPGHCNPRTRHHVGASPHNMRRHHKDKLAVHLL